MNITLDNQQVNTIRFYRGYLELDKTNTKPARCRDCEQPLQIGEGVYRHAYMGIGFICFPCLRSDMLARTHDLGFPGNDAGFRFSEGRENSITQCYTGWQPRKFTTPQVLAAIQVEWKYEIVERLIGPDIAGTVKVQDAADSFPASG